MSKTRVPADYVIRPIEPKVAAYVCTPADVGKLITQAAAASVTLPLANSVPNGSEIDIKALIAGPTIVRSGTNIIWSNAALVIHPASGSMSAGDSYTCRSNGVDTWFLT